MCQQQTLLHPTPMLGGIFGSQAARSSRGLQFQRWRGGSLPRPKDLSQNRTWAARSPSVSERSHQSPTPSAWFLVVQNTYSESQNDYAVVLDYDKMHAAETHLAPAPPPTETSALSAPGSVRKTPAAPPTCLASSPSPCPGAAGGWSSPPAPLLALHARQNVPIFCTTSVLSNKNRRLTGRTTSLARHGRAVVI